MKKLLPQTKSNTSGFTLIELLVVIAIIAILSLVGLTLFGNAQKNARDAKRRADVDAIAAALEVGKTINSSTYSFPLYNGSFAGNNFPQDPNFAATTGSYCIGTNTGGQVVGNPSAAWTNATCTSVSMSSGTISTLSNGTPNVSSVTNWNVCASLENPGTGSVVYCKPNAQ